MTIAPYPPASAKKPTTTVVIPKANKTSKSSSKKQPLVLLGIVGLLSVVGSVLFSKSLPMQLPTPKVASAHFPVASSCPSAVSVNCPHGHHLQELSCHHHVDNRHHDFEFEMKVDRSTDNGRECLVSSYYPPLYDHEDRHQGRHDDRYDYREPHRPNGNPPRDTYHPPYDNVIKQKPRRKVPADRVGDVTWSMFLAGMVSGIYYWFSSRWSEAKDHVKTGEETGMSTPLKTPTRSRSCCSVRCSSHGTSSFDTPTGPIVSPAPERSSRRSRSVGSAGRSTSRVSFAAASPHLARSGVVRMPQNPTPHPCRKSPVPFTIASLSASLAAAAAVPLPDTPPKKSSSVKTKTSSTDKTPMKSLQERMDEACETGHLDMHQTFDKEAGSDYSIRSPGEKVSGTSMATFGAGK